jgi:hypothetical protein
MWPATGGSVSPNRAPGESLSPLLLSQISSGDTTKFIAVTLGKA